MEYTCEGIQVGESEEDIQWPGPMAEGIYWDTYQDEVMAYQPKRCDFLIHACLLDHHACVLVGRGEMTFPLITCLSSANLQNIEEEKKRKEERKKDERKKERKEKRVWK